MEWCGVRDDSCTWICVHYDRTAYRCAHPVAVITHSLNFARSHLHVTQLECTWYHCPVYLPEDKPLIVLYAMSTQVKILVRTSRDNRQRLGGTLHFIANLSRFVRSCGYASWVHNFALQHSFHKITLMIEWAFGMAIIQPHLQSQALILSMQ